MRIAEWRGRGTLEAHRYLNVNDLREHNPTSANPIDQPIHDRLYNEQNPFGDLGDDPEHQGSEASVNDP